MVLVTTVNCGATPLITFFCTVLVVLVCSSFLCFNFTQPLACLTDHDGTLFALPNYIVSITGSVGGNTDEIKPDVREANATNPQQSRRMLET